MGANYLPEWTPRRPTGKSSRWLVQIDGHSEPAPTSEGRMVSGQETVFCWVPVP